MASTVNFDHVPSIKVFYLWPYARVYFFFNNGKPLQVAEPEKPLANGCIKSSKSPKTTKVRQDVMTTQEDSPPIYKRPPLEKRRSSLRGYPQVVFPTICEGSTLSETLSRPIFSDEQCLSEQQHEMQHELQEKVENMDNRLSNIENQLKQVSSTVKHLTEITKPKIQVLDLLLKPKESV